MHIRGARQLTTIFVLLHSLPLVFTNPISSSLSAFIDSASPTSTPSSSPSNSLNSVANPSSPATNSSIATSSTRTCRLWKKSPPSSVANPGSSIGSLPNGAPPLSCFIPCISLGPLFDEEGLCATYFSRPERFTTYDSTLIVQLRNPSVRGQAPRAAQLAIQTLLRGALRSINTHISTVGDGVVEVIGGGGQSTSEGAGDEGIAGLVTVFTLSAQGGVVPVKVRVENYFERLTWGNMRLALGIIARAMQGNGFGDGEFLVRDQELDVGVVHVFAG